MSSFLVLSGLGSLLSLFGAFYGTKYVPSKSRDEWDKVLSDDKAEDIDWLIAKMDSHNLRVDRRYRLSFMLMLLGVIIWVVAILVYL